MTDNRAGGGEADAANRFAGAEGNIILPFGRIKDASKLRIACVYNGRLFHVALTEILALAQEAAKTGDKGARQ